VQNEEADERAETDQPEVRVTSGRWTRWLPTALLGLAVLTAATGTAFWLAERPSSNTVEIFLATPTEVPLPVVHVTGAVVSPGVYEVPANARVGDAIVAAGGGLPGADIEVLNLAATVVDGQRIEVEMLSVLSASNPVIGDTGGVVIAASPVSSLIDLNSADQSALETLPNIGESRALAIIDWRQSNGPFESLDSLRDVPGIGPETVSGLRGLVIPE
jgi:competence protein ComEA